MKAALSKIKKLQGIKSGMNEAKNQINDLKHKEEKQNIQSEQQEEKIQDKDRLRSLWDNFKCMNIRTIGLPEGEKKE